jgi:hypothetical protein
MRIAQELNLDIDQLEADLEAPRCSRRWTMPASSPTRIGLQGYLIGDRIVPGAPEDLYDQLSNRWPRSARTAAVEKRRSLLTDANPMLGYQYETAFTVCPANAE